MTKEEQTTLQTGSSKIAPLLPDDYHIVVDGISLQSTLPLWSNPPLRSSPDGMPAVLSRPGFLDLLKLCTIVSIEDIKKCNSSLHEKGELSDRRFQLNTSMLRHIEEAIDESR